MGKGKLQKFSENASFGHVIEPTVKEFIATNHPLKGKWNEDFFKNQQPIVLELGCGRGEYSVGMARMFPEKNFIGVDIKGARIWKGAKLSFQDQMKNIAFLRTRIELINNFFAPGEVDEIWITFPDPQKKKRRAKKRLTSSVFLKLYQNLLKDNGIVHLKTDSTFMYDYTVTVADFNKLGIIQKSPDLYSENWVDSLLSIKTYYEGLHIDEGTHINYICFHLKQETQLEEPEFEHAESE